MDKIFRALTWGIITGLSGLIISVIFYRVALEEKIGLDLLFQMRGERQAPSEVIVVSMDRVSADTLKLSHKPERWPRSIHARLVQNLAREGAGVITFDIFFSEPRSGDDDRALTEAIDAAKNVVLVGTIKRQKIVVKDEQGVPSGDLNIEKFMPPIPPLMQSAVAVAPFPLPKVPVRVSQYWTFKTGAGDTPTLPIAAFQVFTRDAYDSFIQLLKKHASSHADDIPTEGSLVLADKDMMKAIRKIREIFRRDSGIGERMLQDISNAETLSSDPKKRQRIRSLIRMYGSPDSQYLNYYGPPQTLRTVSYHEVLSLQKQSERGEKTIDFRGKAVFVGSSASFQPDQLDGFNTVYSDREGLDISGVEIAATAFANLLEDMPVRQPGLLLNAATIFFWGVMVGSFCSLFPVVISALVIIGMGVLYVTIAAFQFKTNGAWYPLVVPLFFQVPFTFVGVLLWKYKYSRGELQNLRKAFSFYLPEDEIDRLSTNVEAIEENNRVVYSTCLSTDARDYTSVCEKKRPVELGSFMNKYYEAVFQPIKDHKGVISDVTGDSALAIWAKVKPDSDLREKSCLTALDIERSVDRFNQSCNHDEKLPTRIGLHWGRVILANLGALGRYEYRVVGDIVNTASRIEGLNKYLGTRILLSREVLSELKGFKTREVGMFVFAGKTKPVEVHELICREEESEERQRSLCRLFAEALADFRRRSWDEASEKFDEIISRFGGDGASVFYRGLCAEYREKPLDESWDGVIYLDRK